MSEFSASDSAYMARALRLAARGRYTAHPNPVVGCVLVRNDVIVGEGWHREAGEPHAEVNALHAAGSEARGAIAYVTLEPCAHHGKTPPCIDALIEAGVAEVCAAMQDPFDGLGGRGLSALTAAGIRVRVGLMQAAAEEINAGFLSRVTRGRPFVRMKIASSLDGRIAMADGQSQWITGRDARADVQRLRARTGAILTGIGTVLADDPSLTVRDPELDTGGRQPLRVVLDSHLRMPFSARMLALPGQTLIYCTEPDRQSRLEDAGAEVTVVDAVARHVNVVAVLSDLAGRGVNEALVEAGPSLTGSMLEDKLVDELVIYQAPHIMGSQTMGMVRTPTWVQLADRQSLDIVDERRVGSDTRITARPITSET
jgi:diaminohydroxyphosphoribosylaminopyrimidine deaminase/5-amino-6-(5-phosphoribosylamino)uracil reductase